MSYLVAEDFLSERLPEVQNEADVANITQMIKAVSLFIDKFTNRENGYFAAAAADPAARFFRGDGTHILRIPQHIPGTAAVEHVPITAYYEHDPSGWLYKFSQAQLQVSAELSGSPDHYPIWTKGTRYSVAARWGFSEIPADIAEAAAMIVLRWWETQKGTLGQLTPNGFVIERDLPPAARTILSNYVRKEFEL